MRSLLTLGFGATALSLAAGPAPARAADPGCPSGQACVVVRVVGTVNATRVVTPAEIAAWSDLPAQQYDLEPGGSTDQLPALLSVAGLVSRISPDIGGIGAGNVTYVSIPRPSGNGVATLDQSHDRNLGPAGANGFADGKMPAIYVAGPGTSIGYIRPLRGPADDNHLDYFQTSSTPATSLVMTLHTSGQVLHPVITASTLRVQVGAPVTFTAQVDDTSTQLSYAWTIGGVGPNTRPRPTVRWTQPSTSTGYAVTLSVTDADSSAGQSNYLFVVVDPKPTPEPTKTPSPTTQPDPTQPPGGTGGTANPTTGPVVGDGANAGGDTGLAPHHVGHHGTGAPPSAAPGAAPQAAPTSAAASAPNVPGRHHQASAGGPHGQAVQGIMLAGAQVAPTEQGAPVTAPAVRAGSANQPLRLPGWLLLAAAVLGLLGLGAVSESVRVRGRMRP